MTAIYYGTNEYLAEGNPALTNQVSDLLVGFALLFAVPVAALLIIDVSVGGVVGLLRRRHLWPGSKRRHRSPTHLHRPN